MSVDVIQMVAGDRLPSLVHTIKDTAGVTVTFLPADAVNFRLVNALTRAVALNDVTATISDLTNGQLTYAWAAGDTSVTGWYEAQWKIVFGTGKVQHTKYPFPISIRGVDGSSTAWILSPAYVKAMLDIRTNERDFVIEELCAMVTAHIQNYVGYNLLDQTYTHNGSTLPRLDGTGTRSLFVQHRPVTAVTAAGIRWETDIDVADIPGEFAYYGARGELRLTDGRLWTPGSQYVSLTYRAGYTTYNGTLAAYGITMPQPIRQVALELISRKWQELTKGGPQITEIRVGDSGVSFTINELTAEQRGMLRPYVSASRMVG